MDGAYHLSVRIFCTVVKLEDNTSRIMFASCLHWHQGLHRRASSDRVRAADLDTGAT